MTPQADVGLAPFCTMAVGGPARWFVEAASEDDVCAALEWAAERGRPVHILGGGSNVVVADEGVDGLVIRVAVRGIDTAGVDHGVLYTVGAGEPWDPFVAFTVLAGHAGLECLSGIPGLVGGTPIQNVGAYGQEVSATVIDVAAVDRASGRVVRFANAECGFGYRTSRFKRADADRYVVTRVSFLLQPNGAPTVTYADVVEHFSSAGMSTPTLPEVRTAILDIRRRKGMVVDPDNPARQSCGSFFVNPIVPRRVLAPIQLAYARQPVPHYAVDDEMVKIPAAWLIERAGFPRGTRRGSVGISPFQAQAIVNFGGAMAADVVALAAEVKRAVLAHFGIVLVPEPVFVGFGASPEIAFLRASQVDGDDAGVQKPRS